MRHAFTSMLAAIALHLTGCTWTSHDAHGTPCALEASYECQMYRYSHAP